MEERNRALLSADKEIIKKYMNKYNVSMPSSDEAFWFGVKRTISVLDMPITEKINALNKIDEIIFG